jgi:LAO/AO transport system kinase
VEIASTAHTTLVVEAPGFGDEVQAIKAGILEIADILVVNKADRPGMDKTVRALEMMLEIENSSARLIRHHGQLLRVETPAAMAADLDDENRWKVTVMKTIATDGSGILELRERIDAHRRWLVESGEMAIREQLRIANTLENIVRAELNRRILARLPEAGMDRIVESIRARETDPYAAAGKLLAGL